MRPRACAVYAERKPIYHLTQRSRETGTDQSGGKIHVTVFSRRPSQDDSLGRRRPRQRPDCPAPGHPPRSRQLVAQTLFHRAAPRAGGTPTTRAPPVFSPQRPWCKLKPWPVNCPPPSSSHCPVEARRICPATPALQALSPASVAARIDAGFSGVPFVPV